MSYRPLTDMWILARAKLKGGEKYYGAYPGGFPERARKLLGVTISQNVLHVCGGKARLYPYSDGFGINDETMDIDPELHPDYLHDVRTDFPYPSLKLGARNHWSAILADPPYSEVEATRYKAGADVYPTPNLLVKNCIDRVPVGGRVGILHYIWPKPPGNAKSVAAVGVLVGFNNRIRIYSVFERIS